MGQEERRVCAGETYGLLTAVEPDPEKHKSPQWLCRCQCGAMTSVQERHLLSGHTKSCGCLVRKNRPISIGDTFGLLTVEGPDPERHNRQYWLCRCECGSLISVQASHLRSGHTKSCGCLARKNRPISIGDTFGLLTVEGTDPERHNRQYWLCRCQCGTLISVQASHLRSGHTKSCGCLRQTIGAKRAIDIAGKRFGRLVALEPTENRRKSSVIWRCQCDCGKEVECETEDLTRGKVRSCGCLQEEQRKINMAKAIHFVDGTCIEKIACQKLISTNTSGHRGVSRRPNGTWRACMDFRGKRYDLGTYRTFEEAVRAREKGEERYHDFLADYYAKQHKPELRE